MREPKLDLYPKDIEAIAKAAFEAHLPDEYWDEKGEDVKSQWRDRVEPAIKGRHSPDGLPAIEAAIVLAWDAESVKIEKAVKQKALDKERAERAAEAARVAAVQAEIKRLATEKKKAEDAEAALVKAESDATEKKRLDAEKLLKDQAEAERLRLEAVAKLKAPETKPLADPKTPKK